MVCLIWSLGIASFTLGLKGENKMGLALLSINTRTTQGFDSKYCLYLLIPHPFSYRILLLLPSGKWIKYTTSCCGTQFSEEPWPYRGRPGVVKAPEIHLSLLLLQLSLCTLENSSWKVQSKYMTDLILMFQSLRRTSEIHNKKGPGGM